MYAFHRERGTGRVEEEGRDSTEDGKSQKVWEQRGDTAATMF